MAATAAASVSKLISTKLSPTLFVYEPAASSAPLQPTDPSLVVLLAWMGAKKAHAEKYVAGFQALFPNSPVAVVLTNPGAFYLPASSHLKTLDPAVSLILARTSESVTSASGPSGGLLLSSMSNGGFLTLGRMQQAAVKLTQTYSAANTSGELAALVSPEAGRGLPLRAVVLDSSPGGISLVNTIKAFLAPVQSPLVYYPAALLVSVVYAFGYTWCFLTRTQPTLVQVWAYLNSPAFPAVPRLYLYSNTDALIPAKDVEQHAAAARQAGLPVASENFGASAHVSHARTDPKRYWDAIKALWERATSAQA